MHVYIYPLPAPPVRPWSNPPPVLSWLSSQVNMKGDYSEAYIKRHPGAPPAVQWQAGVVVKKGAAQQVETATWSSRANW